MPGWLRPHSRKIALAAIVVASTFQSVRWGFLVPIYQAPDEPVHLDYALCLYENRGLFRPTGQFQPTDVKVARHPERLVHPYSLYLRERTQTASIRFNPSARMPGGYGTAAYYAALDRDAPGRESIHIDTPPVLARGYPFGYYGLLALWISAIRCFSDRLTVLFFGARLLSSALLIVSLLCVHGTLRGIGIGHALALIVTACVGLFPLTTFVASYIQPDNLSFALVSLAFCLATIVHARPGEWLPLTGLGLSLGALSITKQHYCVAAAIPIAGMLIADCWHRSTSWFGWLRTAILFFVPGVAATAVFHWTMWRAKYDPLPTDTVLRTAHGTKKLLLIFERLQDAVTDCFAGMTHNSFWGLFGWVDTPLVIGGGHTMEMIKLAIQICAWLLLGLTLIRAEQVASRLYWLARRRQPRIALALLLGNPVLNSYFLFTVIMISLRIRTNNVFGAQGRNWLPVLLPVFVTGLVYAPKALTIRNSRRILTWSLTAGLALFVTLGAYSAPRNILKRYYAPLDRAAPLPRLPSR
jgi:hypothetical protein